MHIINILILSLFFVFNTTAQQTFSQKDFNKLLPLTQDWKVASSMEDHAFESWERIDDSTLQGNIYRSSDIGLTPTTYVQLMLRNRQIFLERTNLSEDSAKTYTLQLTSILKHEFLFENTEGSKHISPGALKEKIPFYQSYTFDSKKKIDASFQWSEAKGLQTIKYRFLRTDK